MTMFVSCSSQASIATTTAPSTSVSSVRTTVPYKPGAAMKAWNSWVKSFEVVDVSSISKSECGVYAMLITEGSLTFYDWDGKQWADISDQLKGGRGVDPLKVYSHDFTNDGVLDFFVTFGDNRNKGGKLYGSFFAFPWSGPDYCKWSWLDIDNGRDIVKEIESPEVDQRDGVVYASGYESGRWTTYGAVKYLPSSGSFVFQEVFKK
jgi:hypothetical protein